MLHMWSLSVEEQFYIFYPILLLLIVKGLKRRPLVLVSLISLVSFALAEWGVRNAPNPTFFWLPTRAWEMGLGAIVALSTIGTIWTPPVRHAVGLSGLALIIFAVAFYTPLTPFPGMAALPPVLGTAMIIAAGRGGPNIAGRILSWRPLVGVGLISYSLYLWHWPVLVFLNIHFGLHNVPTWAMASGVVMSVILAYFSWRFVEQPFRSRQGFDNRFDPKTNEAFRAAEGNPYRERCMGLQTREELCQLGASDVTPSFVLWGDSGKLELRLLLNCWMLRFVLWSAKIIRGIISTKVCWLL